MCRFQDIDSAMLEWFRMARSKNIPVSGPMLQAKAVAVAEQMQLENFKASNGWLEKFKTPYKIKGMTVSGESGEVHEETVESWKERLPQILAGYSPEDILNMDETGKFYRALPNKSLSEAAKQCRGGKQSKERVTCAFFVNAAGGKEKPIVIGKSANPRCFRGIRDLSTLQCTYFNQKNAWMDFGILDQVVTKFNGSCQRKGRHVLLLLANAPCHPYDVKGKYSNIKVVFLPPNCTSKLQPLDLGIIQSFKLKYTKLMMTHMISQIEDCETARDVCKSINVLQAIRWIAQAWEAVEPFTIVKCFTNAGVLDKERNVVKALTPPSGEDPFSDLEDDVLQVNALLEESCGDTATSADESIADENLLPVCQEVDENWEQKFLSSLSQNSNNEDGASDDEEIVEMDDVLLEPLKIKSYKEALSELNHVTNFFTAQSASQLADELSKVVSKAQSVYLKQRLENAVQKKITDFFNS